MLKVELKKKLINSNIIRSQEVSEAFEKINRENFVPQNYKDYAYIDVPLPISETISISSPHLDILVCELSRIKKGNKVLEVGTGTGYLTAMISYLIGVDGFVTSLEINQELVDFASKNLEKQKELHKNFVIKKGNGIQGYFPNSPYDKIIFSVGVKEVPKKLIQQLNKGGILVIPIKENLMVFEKNEDNSLTEHIEGFYDFETIEDIESTST